MDYLHNLVYKNGILVNLYWTTADALEPWPFEGATPKLRTITEVCKDVDKYANSKIDLFRLRAEVLNNKKKYSLIDLEFMVEYIDGKINGDTYEFKIIPDL